MILGGEARYGEATVGADTQLGVLTKINMLVNIILDLNPIDDTYCEVYDIPNVDILVVLQDTTVGYIFYRSRITA